MSLWPKARRLECIAALGLGALLSLSLRCLLRTGFPPKPHSSLYAKPEAARYQTQSNNETGSNAIAIETLQLLINARSSGIPAKTTSPIIRLSINLSDKFSGINESVWTSLWHQ